MLLLVSLFSKMINIILINDDKVTKLRRESKVVVTRYAMPYQVLNLLFLVFFLKSKELILV